VEDGSFYLHQPCSVRDTIVEQVICLSLALLTPLSLSGKSYATPIYVLSTTSHNVKQLTVVWNEDNSSYSGLCLSQYSFTPILELEVDGRRKIYLCTGTEFIKDEEF
jgi:hypothetical protein